MAMPAVVLPVVLGLGDPGRRPGDHGRATTPKGRVASHTPQLPPAPHIFKSLFTITTTAHLPIPARQEPVSNYFLQVATV